jgi:DNA-binding NarL/FixJ family response regulator
MSTRVFIIDAQQVFVSGLTLRLEAESDLSVVGTATSAALGIPAVERAHPDVVIIEAELHDAEGIDVVHELRRRHGDLSVVVVTAREDWPIALEAVRAGASALVTKSQDADELVNAVRGASAGEAYIPPGLLSDVLRELQHPTDQRSEWRQRVHRLTPREHDVLQLMMTGLDRATIARRLYVSPNTVRTHTKNILAKLKVHSTLEAVALAVRAGVRPGDVGE